MTYKLNPELKKIVSPVVLDINGERTKYPNGEALTKLTLDKNFLVESISIEDAVIVVRLILNNQVNNTNWAGEEIVSFL